MKKRKNNVTFNPNPEIKYFTKSESIIKTFDNKNHLDFKYQYKQNSNLDNPYSETAYINYDNNKKNPQKKIYHSKNNKTIIDRDLTSHEIKKIQNNTFNITYTNLLNDMKQLGLNNTSLKNYYKS